MVECCNGPYLRSLFHIFWLHVTDSWKDLLHLQRYPGVTEAFSWAWSLAGLSDMYHMTHPSTTFCSEIQNIFNMHNWHNKETNRQLRLWLGNCSTVPKSGWSSLCQKRKRTIQSLAFLKRYKSAIREHFWLQLWTSESYVELIKKARKKIRCVCDRCQNISLWHADWHMNFFWLKARALHSSKLSWTV